MVRVIGQHGEALVVGVRRSEVLLQWRTGQWRRTRQWKSDEELELHSAPDAPGFQSRRQTL